MITPSFENKKIEKTVQINDESSLKNKLSNVNSFIYVP